MLKLKAHLLLIFLFIINLVTYTQESTQVLFINEFMASNSKTITDPDYKQNSDWIELFNSSDSTINLNGYYLTDDLENKTKWQINSNIYIKAKGFAGFWADDSSDKNHTNFKLSKDGEKIGVFSPTGIFIDTITYSMQITDKSYGRFPDGFPDWMVFDIPTPGEFNDSTKIKPIAPNPKFSIESGFSTDSQLIEISSELDSSNIYYTTDGSIPSENDSLYLHPIEILKTTVIRARVFDNKYQPSKTITNTYFINENSELPIFSIVTNPENFFSDERGIYVAGTNGIIGRCSTSPKNWNQDWERPISLEFFEADKNLAFKEEAGIRIFGGCSRLYNQKSLGVYFKSQYGVSKLRYQLFPNKQIHEFNNFILRSSAQDWWRTMFRDGMIQTVIKQGMDVDYQEYRPSIVFLNGEYWGIHNIREKLNDHYLEENHGVDPNNIDLIEVSKYVNVNYGDRIAYDNLINFISSNDMSITENYNYIKTIVDIDEYINYQIAEIYSANGDWPGANSKLWRPKTVDGKWRWMLYDLDFGFGGNSIGQYYTNSLEAATSTSGEDWPNPPWSTLLFRKMLENNDFKNEFIQRFAININTTFNESKVLNIIDSLKTIISPEIPRHKARWAKSISFGTWEDNVEIMREFARKRPGYIQQHIINKFNLSGMETLIIENNNMHGGKVILNNVEIMEQNYNISLFKDVPIHLEAVPLPGFLFAGWQGVVSDSSKSISFNLNYLSKIVAVFKKDSLQSASIVINEINYNSSSSFDTDDWIELYNNSDSAINISGWVLKDEKDDNSFTFPNGTKINEREYLVITKDSTRFTPLFTNRINTIGNFNFGLSGSGELVSLSESEGSVIDSLTYNDKLPWPLNADGKGASLELINPKYDNSLAESWRASENHGSPGKINTVYTDVNENGYNLKLTEFSLEQNYPNPFNPSTIIKYSIPVNVNRESEVVSLIIYNVLGQKVATLVNQKHRGGNYEAKFNTVDLPSGVYIYKLQSGVFTSSKKMILLR